MGLSPTVRMECKGYLMSLYDDLGVDTDATPDQIKASYRTLAQRHHPDKEGGDKEKFQAVQNAYAILSDPERRDRYDDTGNAGPVPDITTEAMTAMAEILVQVVDQVDVEKNNVVTIMKDHVAMLTRDANTKHENIEHGISKCMSAITRLRVKDGSDNFARQVLQNRVADQKKAFAAIEHRLEVLAKIKEMLDLYEYKVDAHDFGLPPELEQWGFRL